MHAPNTLLPSKVHPKMRIMDGIYRRAAACCRTKSLRTEINVHLLVAASHLSTSALTSCASRHAWLAILLGTERVAASGSPRRIRCPKISAEARSCTFYTFSSAWPPFGTSTGMPSTIAVFGGGTTPSLYATRRQNQCERTTCETCSIGTPFVCE